MKAPRNINVTDLVMSEVTFNSYGSRLTLVLYRRQRDGESEGAKISVTLPPVEAIEMLGHLRTSIERLMEVYADSLAYAKGGRS